MSCAPLVMLHYTRRNTIKSAAAALTYHCRGFPCCLLMHFIVFTGASWELTASIWLPHWGTLRSSYRTAKLRSTSPCSSLPLSVCVAVVPCYMQGSQDVSIDHLPTGQCSHPHPLPLPTPAVPTPTSAINIIYQYHIFLWFFFYMGPPSGALHLKIYQSQQELRCRFIDVNLFYVDDGVLKVYLQLPHSF